MSSPVYLDWNATAPPLPQVAAAVADAMASVGNPSSVHRFGRIARNAVETAREQVAALVGAAPQQVVFTSGASEANNLALNGQSAQHVLASSVEHASVLAARGDIGCLPVTPAGIIDVKAATASVQTAASTGDTLVAAMLVNNETGVIQPVAELTAAAHQAGAKIHCDAVQAAGRVAVNFVDLGVDSLALSAHKIGGPMGVGALIVADGAQIKSPMIKGGGQERSLRAGTENVPGIVGFGVAAELALAALGVTATIRRLRDEMEQRIAAAAPEAVFHGQGAPRVDNTSLIGLPGRAADLQVMTFDLAGIAVSAGSACSSGKVAPSHVLLAMGVGAAAANEAVRLSLGRTTTEEDIQRFVDVWLTLRGGEAVDRRAPVSSAA